MVRNYNRPRRLQVGRLRLPVDRGRRFHQGNEALWGKLGDEPSDKDNSP